MSMKALEDLRETLCKELDEIARKGEIGAGDLEAVHKLTDTIKNIDKIGMLEDGGYSQARNRESRVMYNDGNSYARRGEHYVRGHYSRDDGKEHMIDELHELMEDAQSEHQRSAIRRCIEQLKNG